MKDNNQIVYLSWWFFSWEAADIFDGASFGVDGDDNEDFLRRFKVPGTEKILNKLPKLGVEPRPPPSVESLSGIFKLNMKVFGFNQFKEQPKVKLS